MKIQDQELYVLQSGNKIQILVPSKLQRAVFDSVHSMAHPGIKAMIKLLKDDFYWPYMNKQISEWVNECQSCKRNKSTKHTKSEFQPLPAPTERFSAIHVDCVGPFPENNGFKFLFTIIDRWTGWPEAVPIADTTTANLVDALIQRWIPIFGVPDSITSDRGAQFLSELWNTLCERLGIQKIRTSSYHPCSNGKVERFNGKLKQSLRCRLDGKVSWLDELPWALLGIRNFPNQDSSLSPAELVFGQKLHIPGQLLFDIPSNDYSDFNERLQACMRNQRFIDNPWHTKVDPYIPRNLQTCKEVFVRNDRIRKGLSPLYTGPYQVLQRTKKLFLLKLSNQEDWVSVDRLIPYI